jgi:membrane protein implicated in regulation of membrane protease activity
MTSALVWWTAAGLLVLVELFTGTFYLLMIALGLAAGALAAHWGTDVTVQLLAAAAVGSVCTLGWHWRQRRHPAAPPTAQDRDVNLDVGEHVQVSVWGVDGTTRVQHRGSAWQARLAPEAPAQAGAHVVVAVEGNWLVLQPALLDL